MLVVLRPAPRYSSQLPLFEFAIRFGYSLLSVQLGPKEILLDERLSNQTVELLSKRMVPFQTGNLISGFSLQIHDYSDWSSPSMFLSI